MAIKSKIKGKKKHVNKPTSKKYTKYKVEGDKIVSKARSCRDVVLVFSYLLGKVGLIVEGVISLSLRKKKLK